jgi:hypothetical protein
VGAVEDDKFLGYPIKLERWLMEGSYDLVWKAMASNDVPSPEYGVFSEVNTIFAISDLLISNMTNIRTNRSSHPKSAPRLPHAVKQPIHPSQSHQRRISFS